jgi:hypothetical protein
LLKSKNYLAVVVGGKTIAVLFGAVLALLDEIKPIGIGSFIADGVHKPAAQAGAVAGHGIVNVLAGETERTVVPEGALGGGHFFAADFAVKGVIAGNEITAIAKLFHC